jgi:hypothetical protein
VVPGYLQAMVRRPVPPGAPVVAGSTPVVAFGEFRRAEVATLGINPSAAEFRADGRLLGGSRRRLATTESLGLAEFTEASDEQLAGLVEECVGYFARNPYWRWFAPLEELLRRALRVSYRDGTACHLDLVQWATDPVWGRLADAEVRKQLLAEGAAHLAAQLRAERIALVLCNGRQVVEQVRATGLASLAQVGELAYGTGRRCRLYAATGGGVCFLGWSTNLQSSFGVTTDLRARLASWITTTAASTSATVADHRRETPVSEAYVVQFPHPGREHRPSGEVMPWNEGDHRRKFLLSEGAAQDADGVPRRGRYVF